MPPASFLICKAMSVFTHSLVSCKHFHTTIRIDFGKNFNVHRILQLIIISCTLWRLMIEIPLKVWGCSLELVSAEQCKNKFEIKRILFSLPKQSEEHMLTRHLKSQCKRVFALITRQTMGN